MFWAFTVIMLLNTSRRWLWARALATERLCSWVRTIGDTVRVSTTSTGITARVSNVSCQL